MDVPRKCLPLDRNNPSQPEQIIIGEVVKHLNGRVVFMKQVKANDDTVKYEKQLQYELNLIDSWSVAFHLTFKHDRQRGDIYGSDKRNAAVLQMISDICKKHKLRYSDLIIFVKEESKREDAHIHGLIGGFKGFHNLGDYLNRDVQKFFAPKNICDGTTGKIFKKEIEKYWGNYLSNGERRVGECSVKLVTEKKKQVNYASKIYQIIDGKKIVVMRNMFFNKKLENKVNEKLGMFRKHCKNFDNHQIVKWVPHL